jgi:MATE family multidrug resistance protein
MIVSRAGLAGMGIADAIMVARFNPGEFATLSLADGTLGRVNDVFVAFVLGGLILVPRAFGAGDLAACARIWRRAMLAAIGLGFVATAIGLCGGGIFHALGQGAYLTAGAGRISAILAFGYVAGLVAIATAVFLEGMRRPTIVAAGVVIANILNIALNWLLIGGNLGLPAMGAAGSALSTTLVRIMLAIVLAAYAARLCATSSRRAETAAQPALETVPAVASDQHRLGFANAAVTAAMIPLTASLLVFAGWLGPLAVAVLSATLRLNAPVMLVFLGIADATGIEVAARAGDAATRAGARGASSERSAVVATCGIIAVLIVVIIVVWTAVPRALASIFTPDHAMQDGLVKLIPIGSLLLALDAICVVFASSLRALRDIAWPTGIELSTMVALVPTAAWLAFRAGQGVSGLLLAAVLTAVPRAVGLWWRFWWLTRPSLAQHTIPLVGEPS